MFNQVTKSRLVLIGAVVALTAGCASKPVQPTLGDAMREHSEDMQREADTRQQLAEDWERGAALVKAGEKKVERGEQLIREAEELLEKGTRQVERGTREIAEGRALKTTSERLFRELFPDLSLDPDNIDR